MAPFVALIIAIAALPLALPRLWERPWFQAFVVVVLSAPPAVYLLDTGRSGALLHAAESYASFICTLGALFVAAGGVYASVNLEPTPRNNLLFLVTGSVLASVVGTMGASVLVIRPLLRTNRQRRNVAHLVPFFILAVGNAGGLLTPLGDPPLLLGFIEGVPFFWTLRLWPAWLLYVTLIAAVFFFVDRRAYAKETPAAPARDTVETAPAKLRGAHNLLWLVAVVGAALLPSGWREGAMLVIGATSFFGTARAIHVANQLSFAPLVEVAMLFAGLFVCLVPVEAGLESRAAELPLRHGWQLFWGSGLLSAVLDNAPTYAAFTALARGLSAGKSELVACVTPLLLGAISIGTVVMGATTYIGNGPNLVVKAIAERSGYKMPSFARFALFAFVTMLPAHLLVTAVLVFLERR
jgi:Na+/H+ antiporter NhaD/arsenite permease-like protein